MKNPVVFLVSWFFNLGTRKGLPKYVAILCVLQSTVLFVPESTWTWLGINSQDIQAASPAFVQHYIINSSFKNAMSVFWMTSPFTFIVCTALWISHLNTSGYQAFLDRRMSRLKKSGKTSDYSLDIGILVFIIACIWSTAVYLTEPTVLGSFVPTKNRFAMLFFQAGALIYVLPAIIAGLFTDIRANLTTTSTR